MADLQAIAAATGALAPATGADCNGDGNIDISSGNPLVCSISSSGQGIAQAIVNLVESAAMLPVADAGGPYTGEPGVPLFFSGSGSYDPDGTIAMYEWDFESDGVSDVASTRPTAQHAYPAEFSGMVTLRVTDNEGNQAVDTAPVEVVAPVNQPPVTSNVAVSPSPACLNGMATVSATVDDSTTGSSTVIAAEYSLNGALWTAMAAADGAFDEVSEDVTASFTAAQIGGNTVCVRGTDAPGDLGVEACVPFVVTYDFEGFYEPIYMGTVNLAQAGRAIPACRGKGADRHG